MCPPGPLRRAQLGAIRRKWGLSWANYFTPGRQRFQNQLHPHGQSTWCNTRRS